MKKLVTAAVATVIGCSLVVLAQEARRDGKWEVKTEMSMPGMQMPATTSTQCITKEEAADPQKSALAAPAGRGGSQSDCKVSDYKTVGNKVTYTMTCTTPQPAKMTAEIVYGVDKFDGTMTMDMARGGQSMAMTMKYSGKRLGDCVK